MIFIQREGTTGTVRFSGDAARVLDSNGQVVRDWTTGGELSGIPQGDGYKLEVRTGTTVRADDLAIGAVIFVMGQSNIQRWFDTPPDGLITPGIYTMEGDGRITNTVTGGAAQHFTQGYAAAIDAPVMIVEGARGGTALLPEADKGNGHWLSTASGSLYANVLARLEQVGGRAEQVLWGQGETDASANVTTSAYAAGLTQFMNRVLADFEPDRVLIQEIGPRGSNDGKYDEVRAAQHQVADALARVDIGAITIDTNTIADGIHLSGASRTLAADRMLISALALEGIDISRDVWEGSDSADDNHVGGSGRDELRGRGGNDTLNAGAGSDVVLGGAGNDVLFGEAGHDIMRGDGGNDTLDGGTNNDVLSGGEGADSLLGGDGRDEIWGDAGDDTLEGGQGNDVLFGDAGTDVATFSGARAGYTISISGGTVRVTDINSANGNEGIDILTDIEFLRFSDMTIDPHGQQQLPPLFSENTDFVDFETVVAGTYSPSSLYAALDGDDEVYLPANRTIATASGYDTRLAFDAGAGDDIVIGGSFADTIRGGIGSDILNGGGGDDRLDGGLGNDTYIVNSSSDVVFERENEGIDTVQTTASLTLKSHVENLVLLGTTGLTGTGNDLGNILTGNSAANRLSGKAGDDTLQGGSGADTIDGDEGTDIAAFSGARAGYSISFSGSTILVTDTDLSNGDDGADVLIEIELLRFSDGTIDPVGSNLPSLFTENTDFVDFANVVAGTYAATSLYAALGGNDEVYLPADSAAASAAGYDVRLAFDAGAGDDIVIGGGLADTIRGGDGSDILNGGGGNDRLDGGLGNDTYIVNSSGDVVFEQPDEGIDTVQTTASLTLKSHVENLVLLGTSSLTGTGNDLGNIMTGNAASNRLSGKAGDDTLHGGEGNDTLDGGVGADSLVGGLGNDRYIVDDAGDTIAEDEGGTTDEVQSTVSFTLTAGLDRLTLLGTGDISGMGNDLDNRLSGNVGNNELTGGAGRDTLLGLAGNDLLSGGTDNDSLEGGTGADTLYGGDGNDRFIFRTLEEAVGASGVGPDVIGDFVRGDRIDLSRLDAVTATTGTNETFIWRGSLPASGAGQLTFTQDAGTGVTDVHGHLDGDGVADFTLRVLGLVSFTSSDFSL